MDFGCPQLHVHSGRQSVLFLPRLHEAQVPWFARYTETLCFCSCTYFLHLRSTSTSNLASSLAHQLVSTSSGEVVNSFLTLSYKTQVDCLKHWLQDTVLLATTTICVCNYCAYLFLASYSAFSIVSSIRFHCSFLPEGSNCFILLHNSSGRLSLWWLLLLWLV